MMLFSTRLLKIFKIEMSELKSLYLMLLRTVHFVTLSFEAVHFKVLFLFEDCLNHIFDKHLHYSDLGITLLVD